MKAHVNEETCIGCGLCVEMCPSVFLLNDDNKAEAHPTDVPTADEKTCRQAMGDCPVEAISCGGE